MKRANDQSDCEVCRATGARRYQLIRCGSPQEEREFWLCVRCARAKREQKSEQNPDGLTRKELIAELDHFFTESGAMEICRRCHLQGTGCCPPTCRVMGMHGCDPNSRYGKTVFCAAFVCSALLNAISECDPDIGRELRRIKREFGPAEFHIYEMITRIPASARETARPLVLPKHYPQPTGLDGEKIRSRLLALAGEVLEIRRHWRKLEISESLCLPSDGQSKIERGQSISRLQENS